MKHPLTSIVAGVAIALLSSCGSSSVSQAPQAPSTAAESALASEIFQQVAAYRQARNCSPLMRHHGLDGLARQQSEFLRANRTQFAAGRKDLGVAGFEQRSVAAQRLYGIPQIGENVAVAPSGGGAASSIVKLWANSPSHDHNLRNTWVITGVSVVIDPDGRAFATQIFGNQPNNAHSEGVDSLRRH